MDQRALDHSQQSPIPIPIMKYYSIIFCYGEPEISNGSNGFSLLSFPIGTRIKFSKIKNWIFLRRLTDIRGNPLFPNMPIIESKIWVWFKKFTITETLNHFCTQLLHKHKQGDEHVKIKIENFHLNPQRLHVKEVFHLIKLRFVSQNLLKFSLMRTFWVHRFGGEREEM